MKTLKAKEGDTIAIIGMGGIGLSAVLAAKMINCSMIIAVDIHEYLSGRLRLDKLISRTYKLEDINDAFADLEEGKVTRALIELSQR